MYIYIFEDLGIGLGGGEKNLVLFWSKLYGFLVFISCILKVV